MANNDTKEKGLHEGHRERMREEFLGVGFNEYTPDHKMLEMLLFHCVPRTDTNKLAHQLIGRFGSLAGVLDAPVEELTKFSKITRNNVTLLKLIMPIARRYKEQKQWQTPDFKDLDQIGDYLCDCYAGIREERAALVYLSATGKRLDFEFISTGSVDSVGLSIKDIIKRVLDKGANAVVLAHNHPSGIALPSHNDCVLTEMIADMLRKINVPLLDHIILSDNDFVSMAQSREYSHIFIKTE